MNITLITSLLGLVVLQSYAQTTLFQQDFSSSTAVSIYISSTQCTDKFNGINGPNGSASIVNGALQFERLVNGTTGHFSHTTDFSPIPTSLYIQFDFEVVSATTVAGNSCLLFYVGNAFSNGVGNPSNADTYARFGIVFTGAGYTFAVRNIPSGGGGNNSASFTGKQQLTFVLNNTGSTVTYLQPGGGTKTLSNDTYDLWVGTTRVFTQLPVLTPSQTMADFKLRIDDDVYAAVFQFDNFLIRDINGVLPVITSSFRAVATGSTIELRWQATKDLQATFTIERSVDAKKFNSIGSVKAGQDTEGQRSYQFTDYRPTPGTNYYRIRQTDADGSESVSKLIAAEVLMNVPDFTILDNPDAGTSIALLVSNLDDVSFQLTTLTGQPIPCRQRKMPDGQVTLLPQHPLPSGIYLLTASTETTRVTRRLQVR